jgi:hypothetical protein
MFLPAAESESTMDQDLKKSLRDMAASIEALGNHVSRLIPMNPAEPQTTAVPQQHVSLWVKIPVILAVLGAIWFSLQYIISNEISKALISPNQQIGSIAEDVKQLKEDTKTLKSQLGNITPSSLNNLIAPPSHRISETDLTARLQKASALIDFAMQARFPASPEEITPLLQRVSLLRSTYDSERVRSESDSTSVRLSGYQLTSKQILNGVSPRATRPESIEAFERYGSTIMNLRFECPDPPGNFIDFETDTNPLRILMVVLDVQVTRCKQSLDGVKWIKDGFDGSAIRYRGGTLFLANVIFKNCTFDFGSDPRSKEVLATIRESNGRPVTILIGP